MSGRSRKKDENETQNDESEQEKKSGSGSGGGRSRKGQSQRSREQENNESNNQQQSRGREASRLEEPRELEPAETFEPVAAARFATLRLARNWRMGGNIYGAMHAYERILAKYGGTPAANAAAEELIAMAGDLERQGKFYTALNIFNKIEEYYSPWHEEYYDPWRTAYVRSKRR